MTALTLRSRKASLLTWENQVMRSKLEAGRLDGVGHISCEIKLLVAGRRSYAAIFFLFGAEVHLDDVKCFLIDLVILVVL